MPAAKTLRSQNRKAARNRANRSFTRSRVRNAVEAIEAGDVNEESTKSLQGAISALDRAVTKGVLHRNAAARKKSRLTRQFNALSK